LEILQLRYLLVLQQVSVATLEQTQVAVVEQVEEVGPTTEVLVALVS
jgi:hypothetical protein